MRASYLSWLKGTSASSKASNDGAEGTDTSGNEVPSSICCFPAADGGEEVDLGISRASMRILASPNSLISSTLHASQFTLPPGSRTRPREAKGAEFYYVLQGCGIFTTNGEEQSRTVTKGDVLLVNPWR